MESGPAGRIIPWRYVLARGRLAYQSLRGRLSGPLQERRAAAIQRRYDREARARGVELPTEQQLLELLRQRILPRRQGRPPVAMGQMHIFLTFGLYNWEAILPRALEPFGQISTFEWNSRGYRESAADWPAQRQRMSAEMLDAFEQANRRRAVDAVVAYVSGNHVSPDDLAKMSAAGAAIFNFCWDDKLNFPGPVRGGRHTSVAAIASAIDLNMTNAPGSIARYAVHGGLAMFWPEAAHPEVHRPFDTPFDFDVSFVGARYGWRPGFIAALKRRHGIHVACFGPRWPNGPLSDSEMIRLYSRSRINLGFAGVGDSKRLMCLKGRDFEVPMSGGLYLTQNNPELTLVFDVGREIVTYQDVDDCARTIQQLLADPQRAALVRQSGRARALRDHTYEARWTKVFRMAGLLQ